MTLCLSVPVLMTGAILNAVGILIGSVLGLMLERQFSAGVQVQLRKGLAVLTILAGMHLVWLGLIVPNFPLHKVGDAGLHSVLSGWLASGYHILKGMVIILFAMILGRFTGQLLRIQSTLNRLGHWAGQRFASARADDPNRLNDGFLICTLLFCAGPLGPIGVVEDGLLGNWETLAIKMLMDGLAAMGFVGIYGWGVALSAIPVLVFEGTLTLAVHHLEPLARTHQLLDSVNTMSGFLVMSVALVILELKKVQLADYLPSLFMAPLITWLLR